MTRLKQTNAPKDGVITVTERSIYSNRYIFGPLQNKLGFMSLTEFKINCEWIEYLIETFPIAKVDAFLYLKVSYDRKCYYYHTHSYFNLFISRLLLTSALAGWLKERGKVKAVSILTIFTNYTNITKNGSIKLLALNQFLSWIRMTIKLMLRKLSIL